jgi:D123
MEEDAKLQETILTVFPHLTPADVLSCQCSSWYPTFDKITIKSKIIKSLPAEFLEYLEADTVSIPEGSEDACAPHILFGVLFPKLLDLNQGPRHGAVG